MYKIFIIIFALFSNNLNAKESWREFNIQYNLQKSGITFAVSNNKFYKEKDYWFFEIISKTAGIMKLKEDHRFERSKFILSDNNLKTLSYVFKGKKKDKLNNIRTEINEGKKSFSIKNGVEISHDLNKNWYDRLSVQIDLREKIKNGIYNNTYTVLDKGRERIYIFKYVKSEEIETIFGKTKTIVIHKIITEKNDKINKRNTLTWYAINHNFIPVKIEQYRKKSLKFTADISKMIK